MKRAILPILALALGLGSAVPVSTPAVAQDAAAQRNAERAWRARTGLMWMQAWAFGPLDGAAKADQAPTDATRQAARYLAETGDLIPHAFSRQGMTPDSKAKPEIWTDAAGFAQAAANFKAEAQKLVTVAAGTDAAAFKAQILKVGETCGTCHKAYQVTR